MRRMRYTGERSERHLYGGKPTLVQMLIEQQSGSHHVQDGHIGGNVGSLQERICLEKGGNFVMTRGEGLANHTKENRAEHGRPTRHQLKPNGVI